MSGRRFNRSATISMRPRWIRSALGQAAALAKLVADKAAESLTAAELAIAKLYAKTNTVRVHWGWGGGRLPHQSTRELARRRGGADWDAFRARDRIRRGLPVSWPFQGLR